MSPERVSSGSPTTDSPELAGRDRIVDISSRLAVCEPSGASSDGLASRVHLLLDLSRDAFVETDGHGAVTAWNRQAEVLFGWSRDDVLGRRVTEFMVREHDVPRIRRELSALDSVVGSAQRLPVHRVTLLHSDGHEVEVSGTAYVLGTDDGWCLGGFLHEHRDDAATEDALAHAHLYDPLTGLANRTLFNYRLSYALARSRATSRPVAVLVLDLDRFKAINDALGLEAGDQMLVAAADRLHDADDGSADLMARLGGDEFLVLFDGPSAELDALAFADRALTSVAEPVVVGGREIFVTASAGIAGTSASVSEPGPLLSNAHAAMYQAKARGGGGIEISGELSRTRAFDRLNIEVALHRALERSELCLHYQPVVDVVGGTTVGVEALLRWQHPSWGMMRPEAVVPVAEESGLIVPIGAWVLREACEQLGSWAQDRRLQGVGTVAVNLSARQIDHPGLVRTVEHVLAETGLAPSRLVLEITESALMRDVNSALATLRDLKSLGVVLAVDDFGTGYSSLSYLQRLPVDVVKIDKAFVDGLVGARGGQEIVDAVVRLAHGLGLRVVAEGVQNPAQLERLRALGCDLAQGYLFSEPVPAAELTRAAAEADEVA